MQMVSYKTLAEEQEARREWSGVRDGDDDEKIYGTDAELYEGILSKLSEEYLEERYSLCLEIRDGDRVIHAFPKVACPELILQQLQLKSH